MLTPRTKKQLIELEMIKRDTIFYLNLVQNMGKSQKHGILVFGLIPHVSLFIYETFCYFQKNFPDYARTINLKYKTILEHSRHRAKLLEEKDFLVFLAHNTQLDEEHFNREHTGWFKWRRFFQCDLGLYYYRDNIIHTTTNVYREQIDHKDLGQNIGAYIGHLYRNIVNAHLSNNDEPNRIIDRLVSYKDVKARKYLPSIFNGPQNTALNSGILATFAALNYYRYVLTDLVPGSPDTLFKIKYIVLYHSVIGIEKIKNQYYSELTDRSKDLIERIRADGEVRQKQKTKHFRNILVHYTINDNVPEANLDQNTYLVELIEHFFPVYSADSLNAEIDKQIDNVLCHLQAWLVDERK
ncbi:MAG: hypothetical protein HC876_11685 [Chloroflexaceae bacterium]|nr:hypothetical protein [Chloroflexaceae bacterium]NJO06121.1 hypothetical protein [Chloroflexaceae bacterium]